MTWGRETLWVDSSLKLVALTTVDPLWGQFEIVGQGYETALPVFVSLATKDRLAALAHWPTGMTHAEASALAITGGLLIDGSDRPPVADAKVLIEGSRIVAVGPGSEVRIPPTAQVVDARGKTLLPGLWDMHAHYSQVEWGAVYLAAGVTTATAVPARAMKLDEESGTIEVGKRADLIIVDGNPLENISNIRKVKSVIANGRMYDCAKLWESVGFKP